MARSRKVDTGNDGAKMGFSVTGECFGVADTERDEGVPRPTVRVNA
jgi:hypothetical protein